MYKRVCARWIRYFIVSARVLGWKKAKYCHLAYPKTGPINSAWRRRHAQFHAATAARTAAAKGRQNRRQIGTTTRETAARCREFVIQNKTTHRPGRAVYIVYDEFTRCRVDGCFREKKKLIVFPTAYAVVSGARCIWIVFSINRQSWLLRLMLSNNLTTLNFCVYR